jgi:NodT family efflux transporter outer membrane factor (OMF) lipoprotein
MRGPSSLGVAVILGIVLGGCTVGPDYRQPNLPVPPSFATPSAPEVSTVASEATRPDESHPLIDLAQWWKSFDDPVMQSLIERATQANLNLEIALTRVQTARTMAAVAIAEALPSAGASATSAGGTGHDNTSGRIARPLGAAVDPQGVRHINQAIGVDATWEIDLFGKLRREIEAAGYNTEAAIAARNDVLITVIADVARTYLQLRGLQMRTAVARRSIATARQSLAFVRARYERGLTNESDVALAKRLLAALEATVAPLSSAIDAAKYSIAALLGQYPETLSEELETPGMIPPMPERVPAGTPLDLLRRRPDIRQAERQLAGATARIGVATADLFPRLTLTGATGLQGPAKATGGIFIWGVGPSLSWDILDFGTLDAIVDVADLRAREFLLSYRQTIIQAVQDVDTANSSYAAQRDRVRKLNDAVLASQQAVTLASERYDRGLTDFLNVLDAEREEYTLEDQYAVAEQTAALELVALYKALGGGWEQDQSLPPIHRPQPAIEAAFRRLMSNEAPAQ